MHPYKMSESNREDLQQRLIRPLLWSILAAMAIYGGSVMVSDLSAVGESIAKLGLVGWVIVLGLSLVNYGLRFIRWEIYLGRLNSRIPTFHSLAYYLGGFAFTTTPGKVGGAVRSLFLKRHGVVYVHSLAAFFAERFVDLVAMVLLALVAALTFPEYQWPVLVITVLVMALLFLSSRMRVPAGSSRLSCGVWGLTGARTASARKRSYMKRIYRVSV